MKCDRVMPNLFVGPDPLEAADFEQLRSLNISGVLSLQTEDDLGDRGVGWEEKLALGAGMIFCNVPVTDFDSLDLRRKLLECVSALERMLKAGHTVYVHCTAGVSRSPTVVAAYLHWCLDWPLERAVEHLTKTRNCCPNAEVIRQVRGPGLKPG
jgi:protein-tyrosine phosphatase